MAIPRELEYEGERREDQFIQKFLIPLLQRLGYQVVNYHGQREFGKDLVFSEVDRFSNVVYHGLQAKYEASLGQHMAQELIRDVHEAFQVPFTHPTTGVSHRISSFTLANAGSIADNTLILFQEGVKQFLGCTRTLDGKTLLTLDRLSAASFGRDTLPRLGGLEREIVANIHLLNGFRTQLENAVASQKMAFTVVRLRSHAASAYLAVPITTADVPFYEIERYWHLVSGIETALSWLRSPIFPINTAVDLCRSTIGDVDQTIELGDRIIGALRQFAQQLGAIAAI